MNPNAKILLAEDEPALGLIVKETLELKGFEVLYCQNGLEAFQTYTEHKPELLVLDVMMPKKDGFTLAKEIRMQDEEIPILFLTAKSQPQDVVEGFNLGGNDYLKKPFSIEELIVRINNLLNYRLTVPATELNIGDYLFQFKKQLLQYMALLNLAKKKD